MAIYKYILTAIIILCSFISYAQPAQYTPMTASGYQMKRLKVDSTLHLPSFCGVPTLRGSLVKDGALAIDTCGAILYMWTRLGGWDTVNVSGGGGATDTTSLSNRINLKLNISDTASMLSKYLRKIDTISLSNRINLKLNISDTTTMLNPYLRKIDTLSLSNRINLKLNISDTATMLSPYLRKIDTTNKFVSSVTSLNDSTIRVIKGTTTNDITIRSSATVTNATRLITTVYNNSGITITKGTVVYINGRHSSNYPTILPAQANNEANSYKTFAIVDADILNNATGIVIQAGNITGLNLPTSTFTDGDIVYLSPTIAGGITNVKPLAPFHICKLGSVTRAHPTFGSIEIKIENGWQLDELSDVSIPSVPADSVILQFSRVDSLWHDVTLNNAIGNRYIRPSDTASMLNNYARTNVLNASLATKLNISDTASMLSNYARTNLVNTKLNISDTSVFDRKLIPAYSFNANNTNATANLTSQAFRDTSGTYTGTITWTGTTAPSGATNHSFRFTQVGKCVTLNISLVYATNGNGITRVVVTLPSSAPTPLQPAGLTSALQNLYITNAQLITATNTTTNVVLRSLMRNNATNNGFEFDIISQSLTVAQVSITCQYWTN